MNDSMFIKVAAEWGLALGNTQRDQFALYARELALWNARVNLTAVDDAAGIGTRHFLDSLSLARVWGEPNNLIDIGSGAGFPGLPLKILRPTLYLTLVESVHKKAAFLRHIVAELGLTGVEVVSARAEVLGQQMEHREVYDVATARAVAALPTLAEYCLPLCRVGGRFLAPKSAALGDELRAAEGALRLLGGRVATVEPVAIPGLPPRTIVVVAKDAPTPAAYPRRTGVPERKPL
jgi:16S rRNA (guanine527-N7)-methyltransferase